MPPKKKSQQIQGEIINDDEQAHNKTRGVSIQKQLQEMLNNKNVILITNFLNLALTLTLCLLYLYRTYNMC